MNGSSTWAHEARFPGVFCGVAVAMMARGTEFAKTADPQTAAMVEKWLPVCKWQLQVEFAEDGGIVARGVLIDDGGDVLVTAFTFAMEPNRAQ